MNGHLRSANGCRLPFGGQKTASLPNPNPRARPPPCTGLLTTSPRWTRSGRLPSFYGACWPERAWRSCWHWVQDRQLIGW